ncbi:flagellar biosynthetic protein [Buchnera aphidicola (Nipponaphis monzeni)]|uniref:Flagellar biosynthetic protein FliQ n=1 Tax=Buchnera aphidicola (Nipponaphis monzeni) TaxID=2495405 RepID=A0A455T9T1_9GAMM|nr:flagellar biosynthesis protein FliQ [Buchnera aphidicola]BBI01084.1 flagellar biosynthetic protein [Buchnera aphidicola (Nipponaphis monzeni)]
MNLQLIETMFYEAMKIALMISGPLLITILFVGLIISFFQAATQINEQTLSFIPKVMSVIGVLLILGSWMLNMLLHYIHNLFINIPLMIN